MPKKTIKIKDNLTFKLNETKPVSNISGKYVVAGVSLGNGINGAKWIAPDEELHLALLKELNEYQPKLYIILTGGSLARWNYWEMIKELSDETLIDLLKDIPKDIDEKNLAFLLAKKFINVAKNNEEKYIRVLENYLDKNKKTIEKINSPFKIVRWDERATCDNYDEKSFSKNKSDQPDDFMEKIETTKSRFLQHKKQILNKAKERMIKAQPHLASINFKKLTDETCLQYILEEYNYFNYLRHTEILYPGKILPVLEPAFKEESNDLYWRDFSFKKIKSALPELKETEEPLTRAKSASCIDSLSHRRNETNPKKNLKSDATSLENKYSGTVIDTSNLSPKSSSRMMHFFTLLSKSPPSDEKELALKKIEEATALLTAR